MAEYSEQDRKRAAEIVEQLLGEERRLEGLVEGFSVIDVEAHAAEFLHDSDALESIGVGFPAMEVAGGPPIPVSLAWLLNQWWPQFRGWPRAPYWIDYREALYFATRRGEGFRDLRQLSHEQARSNFSSRASDFLATRLSALRRDDASREQPSNTLNMQQYAGGPRTRVTGCLFSVTTNTSGLSAYWSGAYYISPNYLGAPTSPAKGALQAGTYMFGINGGAYGNTVQWDTNAVCTLPGIPSVHLQY